MTVFIDTSYYIARTVARDPWHETAIRAGKPGIRPVTSAAVINETISLLQRRGFLSAALELLSGFRSTPQIQVVYFAIMKKLAIKKAFTFDEHFRAAGFEILR